MRVAGQRDPYFAELEQRTIFGNLLNHVTGQIGTLQQGKRQISSERWVGGSAQPFRFFGDVLDTTLGSVDSLFPWKHRSD